MDLIHLIVHSYFNRQVYSVDLDHTVLNLIELRPAGATHSSTHLFSVAHDHLSLPSSLPSSVREPGRQKTTSAPTAASKG